MKIDETKIAYCKKLYIDQQGKDHKLIEKSMREVGYSFSVRCLYRSKARPGWIERFNWKSELHETQRPSENKQLASHSRSDSFEDWLKTVSPGYTWDWSYQRLLYEKLNDITTGK